MHPLLAYYGIFRRYPHLIGIGIVALLATLGYAVIIPVLPLYLKENLGISASLTGMIFGAYAVSETLTKTPLGFVSDRTGRRLVIITGLLVSFLVPYLMTLPRHPALLALLQTVSGAGVAAFWPALAALTADLVAVENRAQAMTVFNMSYLIGLGFGPALGTFVNHAAQNNTAAFYLATVILAAAALIGILTLPRSPQQPVCRQAGPQYSENLNTGPVTTLPAHKKENLCVWTVTKSQPGGEAAGAELAATVQGKAAGEQNHRENSAWEELKTLFIQPVLGPMLLISLLQQFGTGFLAPVFVLYGREQLGFTQAEIGHILLVPAFTIALLAIPLGRVADTIGKSRAARYAFLTAALAIFLMPGAKAPVPREWCTLTRQESRCTLSRSGSPSPLKSPTRSDPRSFGPFFRSVTTAGPKVPSACAR